MFYLEDKCEDSSLGHSISDNPKKLFQRGKGEKQDIQEGFFFFLQQNTRLITVNRGKPDISSKGI